MLQKKIPRPRILLCTILLLTYLPLFNALTITEVMYDPLGSDNNKEFVEIYGNISLLNATIHDSSSYDTLHLAQDGHSPYSLIVEDGFDYSHLNCSIYTVGPTIGNGLSQGENITIKVNNYSNKVYLDSSAHGNGHSLALHGDTWELSNTVGGSPCRADTIQLPLNTTNTSTPPLNSEPTQNNSITPNNVSTSCPTLTLHTDKSIYYTDESIHIHHTITNHTSQQFQIEYWIEDLFGKIVKRKRNTSNTNTKSWTPPYEVPLNAYYVKSVLNEPCEGASLEFLTITRGQDVNEDDKSKSESLATNSSITINEIDVDEQLAFGDTIGIDLTIYKGNTRKRAIKIALGNDQRTISTTLTITMPRTYSQSEVTIPFSLPHNCDNAYPIGTYYLTVSGLNQKETHALEIKARNNDCPTPVHVKKMSTTQEGEKDNKQPPQIHSFYTRKRNIEKGDTITFFGKVENTQDLQLISGFEQKIQVESNKVTYFSVEVPIIHENTTVMLIAQGIEPTHKAIKIDATVPSIDFLDTKEIVFTSSNHNLNRSIESTQKKLNQITGNSISLPFEGNTHSSQTIPGIVIVLCIMTLAIHVGLLFRRKFKI